MNSTRAMILTAPGSGAIGVVRVTGPLALGAVRAVFKPNQGRDLRLADGGRPRFCRFGGGRGDEVIVLVGEGANPDVEVQSHGGRASIASVLDDLRAKGVDIGQGEDDYDVNRLLARSATLRVAEILLGQTTEAMQHEMRRLESLASKDPQAARDELSALMVLARFGSKLDQGWKVVLAGRPNVGKSRLLNAIAGFDRSIVSPVPGTTRDVVSARVAIDGWPVELCDTAGVRGSDIDVERAGIRLGNEVRAKADLVVIVLDQSCQLTSADTYSIESYPEAILAANKSDLSPAWSAKAASALPVSAVSGSGIAELLEAISNRLVPHPPQVGAVVPIREADLAWLAAFKQSLFRPDDVAG